MSTRASGFARVEHEHYPTPAWVIDALAEHLPLEGDLIWEPACGTGQMARALEAQGARVIATDVHDHGYSRMVDEVDFLSWEGDRISAAVAQAEGKVAIVTNPPYGLQGRLAVAFIKAGLRHLNTMGSGYLALLLQVDFDSGKTRSQFFRDCPLFDAKITLTRRIEWFKPAPGKAGPSQNHAWFIWRKTDIRRAEPALLYAPREERRAA
ncbi:hypothetical protein AB4037_23190 [Labrys sp. KB_33_2]|uniref:hypothetical protein n=1 Tax=Labrys sp. KB_33_2 TaxID=3237479 RepID=UPI003F90FD31